MNKQQEKEIKRLALNYTNKYLFNLVVLEARKKEFIEKYESKRLN